jgi:hypothetical protein
MAKFTGWIIRLALALAPILLGLAATSRVASASAFVQGTYDQRCVVYPLVLCTPPPFPKGIPQAPSVNLDLTFHGENFAPLDGTTTTADTHLFISADPSTVHARGETAITFSMTPPIHALAEVVTFATAGFNLDAFDVLHFASGTLAPGTVFSFQISEILDSTITGACDASSEGPSAFAAYTVFGVSLPGLYHSSCGDGSAHMSASTTFSSTVGGTVGLQTNFQMRSVSGFGSNLQGFSSFSSAHSVDASNTGAVYITILTPGVTFTSDSGASYQAAPEPGSVVLLGGGCLILAAGAVRRRRGR